MKDVTIYTTMSCSYCFRAKALLTRKGVKFNEIDVTFDREKRAQMAEKAGGRRTVPQIFVGETYLSDCDGLYALEALGRLDPLLESA